MDCVGKPVEERPETLSAIVCFRMRPSEVEQLAQILAPLKISRSKLIRSTLMTGGVMYVGDELIDALVSCRLTIASVGNLLKLSTDQLQAFLQNPMLNAGDQARIDGLLQRFEGVAAELLRSRVSIVGAMEALHKKLEELNRGDFQSSDP